VREPVSFAWVFLVEITGAAFSVSHKVRWNGGNGRNILSLNHINAFSVFTHVQSQSGNVSPSQGVSMNSDLMPSSEPILPVKPHPDSASIEASTNVPIENHAHAEESSLNKSETAICESVNRLSPIPPPSEPMQYRAIGLVRGRYISSPEQFTQGSLVTPDGISINTVLLGRMMSLVKNHLDLQQEHLWVVYPRTRQENDEIHLQIVGVWEPAKLANSNDTEQTEQPSSAQSDKSPEFSALSSPGVLDGKFSVRGEIVYQSQDGSNLVIKIKQSPRKDSDKPKYFKLKLKGALETRAVGKFWDLEVVRQGDLLAIESGKMIADLPKKRRLPSKGGPGGARRPSHFKGGSKKPFRRPSSGETPLPIKKGSTDTPRPTSNPGRPVPKPVKRPKIEES
jgi:hypothetical protein